MFLNGKCTTQNPQFVFTNSLMLMQFDTLTVWSRNKEILRKILYLLIHEYTSILIITLKFNPYKHIDSIRWYKCVDFLRVDLKLLTFYHFDRFDVKWNFMCFYYF